MANCLTYRQAAYAAELPVTLLSHGTGKHHAKQQLMQMTTHSWRECQSATPMQHYPDHMQSHRIYTTDRAYKEQKARPWQEFLLSPFPHVHFQFIPSLFTSPLISFDQIEPAGLANHC